MSPLDVNVQTLADVGLILANGFIIAIGFAMSGGLSLAPTE